MVQNNSIQSSNIFSLFPKYNLEQACGIDKNQKMVFENKKDALEISNKKSTKKKILFGSTLASSIVTAGLLGMVFAKGVHGGTTTKLSKPINHLADKIVESGNQSTKNVVFYARKGMKKVLEGLQSISNFTAFKDWGSDKVLRTNKVTTRFADKSTSMFKKIVDKTLGKKYAKVEIDVQDLTSLLKHYKIESLAKLDPAQKMQKITIKNKTLTLGEWLEKLAKHAQGMESSYSKNFSKGARKLRDKKRSSMLSGVSDAIEERFFKDKKGLFKLSNYKTYVTEDVTKSAQKELEREIMGAKRQVTNNIGSIHERLKSKLSSFSKAIKPQDDASRETVQVLKQQLEEFKQCSGKNEAELREKISVKVLEIVGKLKNSLSSNSAYSATERKEMIKELNGITKTVKMTGSDSKGALEEIMTILKGLNGGKLESTGKQIVSDAEFQEFAKLSKKISKNLEKATVLESGEYFLKQAELKVGSAPTDVLSVLLPVGVGTYAIATSDNKDERISKTLTTCIPLVGTFATFVYGTTKMLSGSKNLVFSLVTGAALSKLGTYADKLYQKYKNTGSVVNVVKDEYTTFVDDITPKDFKNEKTQTNK